MPARELPKREILTAQTILLVAFAVLAGTYACIRIVLQRELDLATCLLSLCALLAVAAAMMDRSRSRRNVESIAFEEDSTASKFPDVFGLDAQDVINTFVTLVIVTDRTGRIVTLNSTTRRMLGYENKPLPESWNLLDLFLPGEMERIIGYPSGEGADENQAQILLDHVIANPDMMMPKVQLRREDGSVQRVMLHLAPVYHKTEDAEEVRSTEATGVLLRGVDEEDDRLGLMQHASQERFYELFENAREMFATITPEGRFLYANPAWQRILGVNMAELSLLERFSQVFNGEACAIIETYFSRAREGKAVDRVSFRTRGAQGRPLELEATLSRREWGGRTMAVHCMLRDVTQERQRERRLAMQLVVNQIVVESASPSIAATRILESICLSLGWDLSLLWEMHPATFSTSERLQFHSAWGVPGPAGDQIIQRSIGETIARGLELPGRAWAEGRPVWYEDIGSLDRSPRVATALGETLKSGCAVPIYAGQRPIGVLEFYAHQERPEDREVLSMIEAVAAILGQMLARGSEQSRVAQLNKQQETLLNAVADGICGADQDGLVSFLNPAAAKMLGIVSQDSDNSIAIVPEYLAAKVGNFISTVDQMIGRNVHELLHGSAAHGRQCNASCPLLQAIELHAPASIETDIYRLDGASFPVDCSIVPILDHGHYSGLVLSFRDISQRYALDRMKDEFVSTVSHELRTPLTSIRGALGLLSSGILGQLNDKAANLMRIALSNSDRLVRLINDILDLERIQSGREPLNIHPVVLSEIVRQAVDGIQPVADGAGIQLLYDAAEVKILADGDRLMQVITNLLSNAVKFSPAGTAVSIMTRSGPNGIVMAVIDQGRGIPSDKLESIFGRFQQVDASDSRQKGGSGLGLAICRTIVQQHGGRIWAERNPVRGATFRVFLPYAPEKMALSEEGNGESSQQAAVYDAQSAMSSSLLLADADVATRAGIAAQLRRHGYRIIETSTVEQTLAAAAGSKPISAVLLGPGLDSGLTGVNGWRILPLLRQRLSGAPVPIVLLSVDMYPEGADGLVVRAANSMEEDKDLLRELGRVLGGPAEPARILVVEDAPDLARIVCDAFTHDGIEVRLAMNRQEALSQFMDFQPHLLVLDLALPDGDGFNVVDWLRHHQAMANLPLVVYSTRDVLLEEREMLRLGPTHLLTKARVQPQQLEALVLTLLRSPQMGAPDQLWGAVSRAVTP